MTPEQKHEISIQGLPKGWRAVEVMIDPMSCNYIGDDGYTYITAKIKIEKIKPRRMTFEFVVEVTKDNTAYFSSEHGYVCFDNKWWRLVEEE